MNPSASHFSSAKLTTSKLLAKPTHPNTQPTRLLGHLTSPPVLQVAPPPPGPAPLIRLRILAPPDPLFSRNEHQKTPQPTSRTRFTTRRPGAPVPRRPRTAAHRRSPLPLDPALRGSPGRLAPSIPETNTPIRPNPFHHHNFHHTPSAHRATPSTVHRRSARPQPWPLNQTKPHANLAANAHLGRFAEQSHMPIWQQPVPRPHRQTKLLANLAARLVATQRRPGHPSAPASREVSPSPGPTGDRRHRLTDDRPFPW